MNHRESWAEERKSPTAQEWARTLSGQGKSDDKPVRKRTEIEEVAAVKSAEPPAPASGPSKVLIRRSGGR